MIRLSRMADYGVVVMTYMARHRLKNCTTHQVAGDTGLSEATAGKLLKVFARDGLLDSHRGVHGGYRFVLKPEDISMARIVEAVEGPIALTRCVDEHPGRCDIEALCPMSGGWNRINAALRNAFEGVSLAAMVFPAMPEAAGAPTTGR